MVKEPHGHVITCLTCFYLQDHPLPTGTYATKLVPHQPIHRRRSHGQKSERDDFGRPGFNLSFSRVGAIAEKTLERWMIRADFGFGIGMRLRVAASGSTGQHRAASGSTGQHRAASAASAQQARQAETNAAHQSEIGSTEIGNENEVSVRWQHLIGNFICMGPTS